MLSLKWVIKTSDEHITLPLSIARIALGLFFFTSGFNKLFVTANQQLLLETLTDAGIPFPAVMAVFVAFCECVGGLMLAVGLLTRLNALILFIISTVALLTVGIHTIPQGLNGLTWYSWLLYLPESLYMLLSTLSIFYGGTRLSADSWLEKKWLRARKIVFIQ